MIEHPHRIVHLIDAAIEADERAEVPFRSHLGGSQIGRECSRQIWYGFRWAKRPSFSGRMLRLFQRGHGEEARFVRYLTRIGMNVREFDEQGKQWRILDVEGHFGGSLDGLATGCPGLDPEEEILLEFKTHNTKSFAKLTYEGVQISKPEHYRQMQIYMGKRQLKHALYMAVNKNDDDLYCEIVEFDIIEFAKLMHKARVIVYAKQPPNRISENATWFACKYCDFSGICHKGEPMERNCRTCQHSAPAENGEWFCNTWQSIIPGAHMRTGCDAHLMITD